MPQEVIDRVNQFGVHDNQPELLTFYDRKGKFSGDADFETSKNIEILNDRATKATSEFDFPAKTENNTAAAQNHDVIESETTIELQFGNDDVEAENDPHDVQTEEDHPNTQTNEGESTDKKIEGVSMTNDEIVPPRRSTREQRPKFLMEPMLKGKFHVSKTLHPMRFLNKNFLTLGGIILTQLSLKAVLTKWKRMRQECCCKRT